MSAAARVVVDRGLTTLPALLQTMLELGGVVVVPARTSVQWAVGSGS